MWNYPKSAKHQAFIDQLQATHERELAKFKAAEKRQERAEDGRRALDEAKAKVIETRIKTARLRAERLAGTAGIPLAARPKQKQR